MDDENELREDKIDELGSQHSEQLGSVKSKASSKKSEAMHSDRDKNKQEQGSDQDDEEEIEIKKKDINKGIKSQEKEEEEVLKLDHDDVPTVLLCPFKDNLKEIKCPNNKKQCYICQEYQSKGDPI